MTDGWAIAYSEREHEFTFAKTQCIRDFYTVTLTTVRNAGTLFFVCCAPPKHGLAWLKAKYSPVNANFTGLMFICVMPYLSS